MKLQDVILKAIARKITWLQAADIAGMSLPGMEQLRRSYGRFGYTGLFDQLPGRRVIYRVPMSTVEKVLELYQTIYSDLNPREFHKKLTLEHNIRVDPSWLKQALQGAGLWRSPGDPMRERKKRVPRGSQ